MRLTVLIRIQLVFCAAALATGLAFQTAAAQAPPQPDNASATGVVMNLSPLETRVLGQSRWLSGGPAALRVIVSNHDTGKPVDARVALTLTPLEEGKPKGPPQPLYTGRTDALGTLNAQFSSPASAPGPYQLDVEVRSAVGNDSITEPVELQESWQLLLTADKPVYQPGQTMHLRALALDMATRRPLTGQPIVFEVEDGRGNKVYKQRAQLSPYGIASCDFSLADEVNMGVFTLRAVLSQGQAEKKVTVERYVLPKFKVTLTPARPYYLPGETLEGTVQASYFFGKPVSDSAVTLDLNTVDIGVTRLTELTGKTDAAGAWKFSYRLPDTFVGQPFEQGKAAVELAATVKDTADQEQKQTLEIPVVKDPVLLTVVPETRSLVPGVVNRVYIAAATADSAPLSNAPVTVRVKQGWEARLKTDNLGIALFDFTPDQGPVTMQVTTADPAGHAATMTETLAASPGSEGIILRSDKSLARVGDSLNLLTLSSEKGGTVYLDVIRDQQTILTLAEPMNRGQARFRVPLTNDMAGTLELHAYKILPNEDIIRDSRVVVVSPANDLNVSVTADSKEYRPGADATLQFLVEDQQHHPVAAALGLAIVDESVFALSELKPGLEKIYFTLEKELMEPKYEIHGLGPVELLQPPLKGGSAAPDTERQRAAAMIFAGAPAAGDFSLRVDTYQQRWEAIRDRVIEEMTAARNKIADAAGRYQAANHALLTAQEGLSTLVRDGHLKQSDIRDPWDHPYRADLHGSPNFGGFFTLSSAGPDGRWGTIDDLKDIPEYRLFRERGFGGRVPLAAVGGGFAMAGGLAGGNVLFEAPRPAAAPMAMQDARVTTLASATNGPSEAPVRVREFFPETMYWNPSLLTDDHGRAELKIPMADSITTWRLSMMADSAQGQLGSATAPVRVFQDFFVDIDLPVALTQHDRVDIPVAVYNYLPTAQNVTLSMEQGPWFTLRGPAVQTIQMEANSVKVVYFPITVASIGRFPMLVTARGARLSDAIRRSVEVLPDGKEFRTAINDSLDGKVEKTVTFPVDAVSGASNIWVKLYPGAFSQVVEGLDGILRMPNGCFEQTSSTTYPDVLVLDYLKKNKRINPELQLKAEQYINVGYQRLVTFECKNGGFSWFGDEPANQVLTAYGLLEFSDMAKVHDVDPALIDRTRSWLANRQRPDGSWLETGHGIAEGIINRQTGALRTTAYIAWALAESGYQGPQLALALQYVHAHRDEAHDPYTLAVILNMLTSFDKNKIGNDDDAAQVANDLIALAKTTDKTAYWTSDTQTFTGGVGKGADLETTGLAAYGLVRWGRNSGFTNKVLTDLVRTRDSFGTWESTQGTVWAMKSLLAASEGGSGGGKGTVTILANGKKAATFAITPDDSDVMRQVSLGNELQPGRNDITLEYVGDGSLLYQIVESYYLPWIKVEPTAPAGAGPLSLSVAYDKTTIAKDDTATVTTTIKNNTARIVEMPLIDLGVPPGFTVLPEKLDQAVQAKTISKYTVAARQVIVYMKQLAPDQTVTLTYQIKARFPIKAQAPLSRAYPYYNPEAITVSAPQEIEAAG